MSSAVAASQPAANDQAPGIRVAAETLFVAALGRNLRALRERRGMPRKRLAWAASVSERYLAQIESGRGNVSVMLLHRVANALGVAIVDLLAPGFHDDDRRHRVFALLEQVPTERLDALVAELSRDAGGAGRERQRRIALIGMRGAGKSTLGALLADALRVPLIELNREVTRETGLPAAELMALYGPAGYRRIEGRAFARVVRDAPRGVIVAGGGIVNQEDAFDLLLASCYTVWIRARPEDHMARVLAQGDLRPMAGNARAMEDLERILASREPMYGRADAIVDTSGETPQQSLAKLRGIVAAAARSNRNRRP